MRRGVLLAAVLQLFMSGLQAAAQEPITIELNALEAAQSRCQVSFVSENKSGPALDSLKLDLVVFGADGAIQRRVTAELGPLRRSKTSVKTFEIEGDCAQIGSILLNEVTSCTPEDPGACLERLVLSSRLPNVRFYK